MGKNRNILAVKELPDFGLQPQRAVIERCESIHCHTGDTRIEWPLTLFLHIAGLYEKAEQQLKTLGKGCSQDAFEEIARNTFDLPETRHFQIEEIVNGTIHIHYRNVRIEMSRATFQTFAVGIMEALNYILTLESDIERIYTEIELPIQDINPYDCSHSPSEEHELGFQCNTERETEDHVKGINLCARLIKQGFRMLPISIVATASADPAYSINPNALPYQRLDGFKRYMAYNLLGYKTILCHLYAGKQAYPGNQRYLPWIIGCDTLHSLPVREAE